MVEEALEVEVELDVVVMVLLAAAVLLAVGRSIVLFSVGTTVGYTGPVVLRKTGASVTVRRGEAD